MTTPHPQRDVVFSHGSYTEHRRISDLLRKETAGGISLIVAAIIAVIWANSPWANAYFTMRDHTVGIESLHLNLSLGTWAADGLLAIFFFLVGLELKQEFVIGDLRDPKRALVPVVAAFGGVAVPALIYFLINRGSESIVGWAIPTATDIAFAVAVLAIIGSHLPSPLRLFLLTLAVVDDLIAIAIIAVFYTDSVNLLALGFFIIPVVLYGFLVQKYTEWFVRTPWARWAILLPIAIIAWALLHAAGIHATIAGVILGFLVPVTMKSEGAKRAANALYSQVEGHGGHAPGLTAIFEHDYRPLSAGFAVPVFAFFSAGVALGGWSGFVDGVSSHVALGIMFGLILGKPIGITLSTFVLTKFTRASLDDAVKWIDLIGVGFLAGIGFTVSLLVGELSFGRGNLANDEAKIGVLLASAIAALIASIILIPRNRQYERIATSERSDSDGDGTPDAFDADPNSALVR